MIQMPTGSNLIRLIITRIHIQEALLLMTMVLTLRTIGETPARGDHLQMIKIIFQAKMGAHEAHHLELARICLRINFMLRKLLQL